MEGTEKAASTPFVHAGFEAGIVGPCRRGTERLAAWQSLAGLVGLPAQTPVPETARRAEQTHWYLFDTEADWFEYVAWDLAIAALRPGGQEIAVPAATDTD
jgi:hypothetical protein